MAIMVNQRVKSLPSEVTVVVISMQFQDVTAQKMNKLITLGNDLEQGVAKVDLTSLTENTKYDSAIYSLQVTS